MLGPTYGYALVTGASGGIGRELARQLSKAGWPLVLVGRNKERLVETKNMLEGPTSSMAVIITCDLSASGTAESLYKHCIDQDIGVELLVNNAGTGLFGVAAELSTTKVESMLILNVVELTSLCTLFAKDMILRKSGYILNIGSVAGNFALPYFASYAASKSYVLSYSLALRAELRPENVSVCCLLPGYVRTGFDESAGISSASYRSFSERNGMHPAAVARSGLQALAMNRPFTAAGIRNKLACFFAKFIPRSMLPTLAKPLLDRMIRN